MNGAIWLNIAGSKRAAHTAHFRLATLAIKEDDLPISPEQDPHNKGAWKSILCNDVAKRSKRTPGFPPRNSNAVENTVLEYSEERDGL
jgi:hypothetical protein